MGPDSARTRAAALAVAWCLLLFAGLAACGSQTETASRPDATEESTPAAPAPAEEAPAGDDARAQAEEIFATRCQTCHGAAGAGDGPGSAALTPKPRNFQDPEWQASVDDDHIANIIQYGGAAVGKSPVMPGNPDLTSKPEVVEALVEVIRDLGAG